MCGRYTNAAKREEIEKEFKVSLNQSNPKARYNIAPSQMIDAVLNQDQETILTELKWGLVPHWAKDPDIGNRRQSGVSKIDRRQGEPLSGGFFYRSTGETMKTKFDLKDVKFSTPSPRIVFDSQFKTAAALRFEGLWR